MQSTRWAIWLLVPDPFRASSNSTDEVNSTPTTQGQWLDQT